MQMASLRRVKYRRLEDAEQPELHADIAKSNPVVGHLDHAEVISTPENQPDCDPHVCTFQSIPQHLLDKVLDSLPPDDLMNALQVCKVWQGTIQEDSYKCKRLAWHHKSFVQPGHVASFTTKRRLLSCTAERRLNELTESVGKTMLLQF